MGLYAELWDTKQGKADKLIKDYGAQEISVDDPVPDDSLKVCVVENPDFDAALICVTDDELEVTKRLGDQRPKRYLVMKKSVLLTLSTGYKRYVIQAMG